MYIWKKIGDAATFEIDIIFLCKIINDDNI